MTPGANKSLIRLADILPAAEIDEIVFVDGADRSAFAESVRLEGTNQPIIGKIRNGMFARERKEPHLARGHSSGRGNRRNRLCRGRQHAGDQRNRPCCRRPQTGDRRKRPC